jgi:L-amino acid N-acyltransferase YncA
MYVRKAVADDMPKILEIYTYAREYMAAHGNPNQWGGTNWPPEDLIRDDIKRGKSYVCENDGKVVGVFYFDQGKAVQLQRYFVLQGIGPGRGDEKKKQQHE